MKNHPEKNHPEKKQKRVKLEGFEFQMNNIKFPRIEDIFRVQLSRSCEGQQVLWIENKKTKNQFQVTIEKLSDYGPSGIPEEAIYAFLKRAFEMIVVSPSKDKADKKVVEVGNDDDPSIYGEMTAEGFTIVLTLSFIGVWRPEYTFELLPVALEKVDIIAAQLADAQEEIAQLEERSKKEIAQLKEQVCALKERRAHLTLRAMGQYTQNQPIHWECANAAHLQAVKSYFVISADKFTITVLQTGLYSIDVRLSTTCSLNGAGFQLLLDGKLISRVFLTNANTYQNSGHLHEALELIENSQLSVVYDGNSATVADKESNRFTIMML